MRALSITLLAATLISSTAVAQVTPKAGTTRLVRKSDAPAVEHSDTLMGTSIEIVILTEDRPKATETIATAIKEMERIEQLMSEWIPGTQVSTINDQAGKTPALIDLELLQLLGESIDISELTEGKFDVTWLGAGKLWDFKTASPNVPSPKAIQTATQRVNYRNLHLDRKNRTAMLKDPGMKIGLGGIAKGYAVDRAVEIIKAAGFSNFAVNAGGDLVCKGRKQDKLWWVGIRNPRDLDQNLAFIPISNLAVVTSGDYERFFIKDGKRYSHILDPDTGWPVSHCQSVTIMTRKAARADALSTGIFVLGPEKGLALIERLPNTEGVIIDGQGNPHVSSGLQGKK